MSSQQKFPGILRDLHKIDVDYADGDGIDFEPYQDFVEVEEVQDWFRAWTGNADATGQGYLIFGQDGTGGYAAIWPIRSDPNLLNQPVVFFGSEGELGVIASNFSDYLWVLASNHGPHEAVAFPDDEKPINQEFLAFAEANATTPRRSLTDILNSAKEEFPDFETSVMSQCG